MGKLRIGTLPKLLGDTQLVSRRAGGSKQGVSDSKAGALDPLPLSLSSHTGVRVRGRRRAP